MEDSTQLFDVTPTPAPPKSARRSRRPAVAVLPTEGRQEQSATSPRGEPPARGKALFHSPVRVPLVLIILLGAVLLGAPVGIYADRFHGFTRWMPPGEFAAWLEAHNEKGTWLREVEGRWVSGGWEMRVREARVPQGEKIAWAWGFNMTSAQFFQRIDELSRKGFVMIHSQSYSWPEGSKLYQAVWTQKSSEAD